jgi:hypothetical protein
MSFLNLVSTTGVTNFDLRAPRMSQWLRHLDLQFYRTQGHIGGFSDLGQLSDDELRTHFIVNGWQEGRPYSKFLQTFIDPDFYMREYPELGLKDSDAALKHWMYAGFFEGRMPNVVTKAALESDYHLFQFGKVGSKAIQHALVAAGHRKLVIHTHWPSEFMKSYPDCMLGYVEIVTREPRKNLNFLTGVRDPFSRIISGYFQERHDLVDKTGMCSAQLVSGQYVEQFFRTGQASLILDWFDHSYFRDIDIYDHPFDTAAGYAVIEKNAARVFLYRLDKLGGLQSELSRFTGLNIRLEPTNVTVAKPYAPLYQEAVSAVRFTEAQVDQVLNSSLVGHFFSAQEADAMRKRWLAPRQI